MTHHAACRPTLGFVGSLSVSTAATSARRHAFGIPTSHAATCSSFAGQSLPTTNLNVRSRQTSRRQPHPSHLPSPSPPNPTTRTSTVTMKKGRLPRHMTPQQRQGGPQQQQNVPLPEDGTPVFALFVRTERTKIWYPLGAVKGDDRSKNMVDALKGGFAKGLYQQALDRGMAQTLYGKEGTKYVQGAVRMYPQLKKYTNDLQFGYKVAAVGLDEQPTKLVTKEMAGTMMSNISRGVGNFFKNLTSSSETVNKK